MTPEEISALCDDLNKGGAEIDRQIDEIERRADAASEMTMLDDALMTMYVADWLSNHDTVDDELGAAVEAELEGRLFPPDISASSMDDHLDMLERMWGVENGDASVEIWRDGSEYPWHITCVTLADEWGDDGQGPTVQETRRTTYSGDTLAEAVAFAWARHRGPVICSVCDGDGHRPATDAEIAEDDALKCHSSRMMTVAGVRVEQRIRPCDACFQGMGYVLTLPKPSEAQS